MDFFTVEYYRDRWVTIGRHLSIDEAYKFAGSVAGGLYTKGKYCIVKIIAE